MRKCIMLVLLSICLLAYADRPIADDCYDYCRQYDNWLQFVACMEGCGFGSTL